MQQLCSSFVLLWTFPSNSLPELNLKPISNMCNNYVITNHALKTKQNFNASIFRSLHVYYFKNFIRKKLSLYNIYIFYYYLLYLKCIKIILHVITIFLRFRENPFLNFTLVVHPQRLNSHVNTTLYQYNIEIRKTRIKYTIRHLQLTQYHTPCAKSNFNLA